MNAKKQFVDLNLRNRRTGISLPACLIAVVAGLAALATPPAQAQTFQVLYTFSGGSDGSSPWGVILDAAGNLYGATREGGSTSEGAGQNGAQLVGRLLGSRDQDAHVQVGVAELRVEGGGGLDAIDVGGGRHGLEPHVAVDAAQIGRA